MIEVIKADNPGNDIEWKEFLRNQYNLFFDFKFNSYNDVFGKRINWHHLKFKNSESKKVIALMIGCEKEINGKKVYVSCDGVSFGGFLWKYKTDLVSCFKVIESFKNYLALNNFSKCIIKNPPMVYARMPNEETEYVLLKSGFEVTGISISNIISLNDFEFGRISETKKRAIKKSSKEITVKTIEGKIDINNFREYFDILLENREMKNVSPTHSFEELIYLQNNLPDKIILFAAYVGKIPSAICVLFCINKDIILNFYLADDSEYKKQGVAKLILYKTIEWAKQNDFKYYDIGTSDKDGELLAGLFAFKKEFLAHGFLRKSFSINLN